MTKRGFERSGNARNVKDSRGRVQVLVRRVDGSYQFTTGNITKSVTVKEAKVSEVFAAIERALFGEES